MQHGKKPAKELDEAAQAEVDYLHQRTSEDVMKAQAAGKQIGRK